MWRRIVKLSTLAAGLISSAAWAQGFDAGSNGSYGPIEVTTGTVTLDMPADGIFHATTITVAQGATLRFKKNALNTPVYLLATGDIAIQGTINVSGGNGSSSPPIGGVGGPGGFDGGTPGYGANVLPGAGHGPGRGLGANSSGGAGNAAYSSKGSVNSGNTDNNGNVYGSPLLIPLVGGSGGGGGAGQPGIGGGGGGGAILLASNTRVALTGQIAAGGGLGSTNNGTGSGSGGAVRIVAPAVQGSGSISLTGGWGGVGRSRVDTINRQGLQINGIHSVGSFMVVFPPNLPRLDIVEAAGTDIPLGWADPVQILLPFGSAVRRSFVVHGQGFTGTVPITVAFTPESGDPINVDTQLEMAGGNEAEVSVDVDLPVNTAVHVHAWTR